MEGPQLEGLRIQMRIGAGGCGAVFYAFNENGKAVAVKIFDQKAICRELLQRMTVRLAAGGWPEGVMRVVSADYGNEQTYWTMPMIGTLGPEAEALPRCLQRCMQDHPKEDSWGLVKSMASALAAMHERRVAHGNLKPGNVFFTENGSVLLSDWAIGNMPGVEKFTFTDAVLYQAPEQLRHPSGYLLEEGYRWDVFAFGVLSYRILTGRFPRCHETFSFVAPPPGEVRKAGIQADLIKVSRNLEAQKEVTWPGASTDHLEMARRGWIDRCLRLDAVQRPFSMIEVAAGLEALERKLEVVAECDHKFDQRPKAQKKASGHFRIAAFLLAACGLIGWLWHLSNENYDRKIVGLRSEKTVVDASILQAITKKELAEKRMKQAESVLSYERDLAISRLEASRSIGDHLFAWAMEKGHRRLPPLDGREVRLKRLERYFEDFLNRTADIGNLSDERAKVRLQLAEISLAAGDATQASRRLKEAIYAWKDLPMDAELRLRLATNSLLLALLRQSVSDPQTQADFLAAREAIQAIPQADVDADRLSQLSAVLDFYEAKLLAAGGEDTKALDQLLRATQTLNRIADHRPDLAILRSELAACYFSSATILEGMGSLGDAREVRALATQELVKLIENDPENAALQLDLAGCYAAMAESAVLAGDIAAAENHSTQAMTLLERLLVSQPDNAEAVARKAALLGLRAGVMRDKGLAGEAMDGYNEGIRLLQAIKASAPQNAMVSFRLAILLWQKGRMIGISGDRSGEIALIQKARDLLGKLESDPSVVGPQPEQLQNSGAYLLGDLGHAMQLANQKEEACKAFSEAAVLWENLLASRPESEEYSEALFWSRQRTKDLK